MIFTLMKNPSPAAQILPFQPALSPALPTVLGNVDYQEFERQLRRMDQLLRVSGVEANFVEQCLARYDAQFRRHHQGPPAPSTAQLPRLALQRAARPAGRGLSRDEPAAGRVPVVSAHNPNADCSLCFFLDSGAFLKVSSVAATVDGRSVPLLSTNS